jgi:hypothetical protein
MACGGSSSDSGPCEGDEAPAACEAACDESTPCESGFYCGEDGTCNADCTSEGDQCEDAEECSVDGQCVPGRGDDDGDDGDDGDDDGANDDGGDQDCPAVEVSLDPVVPEVILLIDQSGSMTEQFPGAPAPGRRWDAIVGALVGANDDGVLFQLQDRLRMGASLYTANGNNADDSISGACPLLDSAEIADTNAAAIKGLLNTDPIDETPTGPALDSMVASFPPSDSPRVIVLATDGLPDTCEDPNPGNGLPNAADDITQQEANAVTEDAAQAAFEADIQVIPLSVAPNQAAIDHLQRVANLGAGLAPDVKPPLAAPVYQASNSQEMVEAFEEIVGGIRSCEIDLEEPVSLERAEEGTVVLNGEELEYGTAWEMVDEDTFTLLGATCDAFLETPAVDLTAEFPCGVVVD